MRALTIQSRRYDSATNGRRSADAVLGPCDSASRSGQASDTTGPVDSTTKCDFGDAFDGWRPRHGSERGHSDESTEAAGGRTWAAGRDEPREGRKLGGVEFIPARILTRPLPPFGFKYLTYPFTSAQLFFSFASIP